jgi:Na+-driven multidrug efflux pump
MAGNSATSNLEGFIYTSMNAFSQTSLNFTSQNLGGKRSDRVKKILLLCLTFVTIVGLTMGLLGQLFGRELLGVYSSDAAVVSFGLQRMQIIFSFYFLCGIMEVIVGSLRGLGYSIMPMMVSLLGACGLRILWIFTVFQWSHSLRTLYASYPISWFITVVIHLICFLLVYKKSLLRNSC